jgi:hypothetical protein
MGTAAVEAAAGKERTDPRFSSAQQLREVLEKLLRRIDGDPQIGPRLQSTRVPHRYEAPDLGVVLNVAEDESGGEHHLRWAFSDDVPWKPKVKLTMDSSVLNRFLQGQENVAIAVARRRMRCAAESRAALAFLPVARALAAPYRELIGREYPELLLDTPGAASSAPARSH